METNLKQLLEMIEDYKKSFETLADQQIQIGEKLREKIEDIHETVRYIDIDFYKEHPELLDSTVTEDDKAYDIIVEEQFTTLPVRHE